MGLEKTTGLYFASQLVRSVAAFVATVYIAQATGASTLGKYVLVFALVYWVTIPAAAVGQAITKRLSEETDAAQHFSAGLLCNAILIVALVALVSVAAGPLERYVGAKIRRYALLLLIGEIVFTTILATLQGEKRVAAVGIIRAIERIVRTVAQVALVVLGYALSGVLAGHVFSIMVAIIVSAILVPLRLSRPSWTHIRQILSFARFSWLGQLQIRTLSWMDTIVLGLFVSPSLVGIYEAVWSLAAVFMLISQAIQQVFYPEISSVSEEGRYERVHHLLTEGIVFTGIFAIPGLVGAGILGQRVLSIYGPEFSIGYAVFPILIIAVLFATYGHLFVDVVEAIDKPGVAFRINLVFVITNMTLNIVLVALIGWVGAAVATAVSTGIMLVLAYHSLQSIIGSPTIPFYELGNELGATIVMGLVVIGLESITPLTQLGTISLLIVGIGTYSGVLLGLSDHIRARALRLIPAR